MRKLPPLLAATAAVAAALAFSRAAPARRSPPATAHSAARAMDAPPSPTVASPRRGEHPVARHAVALDTALHLDAPSSPSQTLTVRLTATLESTPLARGVTAMRLRDPSIALSQGSGAGLSPAARAQLERSIARPFYVERTEGGAARALRQEGDLDPLLAGLQRYLAAALAVTPAPAPTTARWTAREVDTAGACDAVYERAGGAVTRTRSGWSPTRPRRADGPTARTTGASRASLVLDGGGAVESIDARDALRSEVGDGMSARTETHLVARRGPDGDPLDASALRDHLARMGGLRVAALDESAESPAAAEARDRRLVAGASLATLRAALGDVAEGAPLSAATVGTIRRMTALFRLDPRAMEEAARAARDGARPAEVTAITAALTDLGTPEAQRALADLATSSRLPADLRAQAVTSLALAERPTRESLDALDRLATRDGPPEVRTAATLGEGAALHAARAAGASTDDVFTALAGRLARAADDGEAVLVLDALGNTGDPRVLPLAEGMLRHPSADVREAAACAARLVEGGDAVAFLTARMRERRDVAQRVGAVRALGFRPLEVFEAPLGELVRGDEALDVRSRAVAMLGARVRQSPLAAELLLHVAESEADADLRERARSWLRQLDGA